MNRIVWKTIFYWMYFCASVVISFFLPDSSKFVFGFLIAVLAGWAWKVISGERRSNSTHCTCPQEFKPGQTKVWCCNICGKPDDEGWTAKDEQEVNHA